MNPANLMSRTCTITHRVIGDDPDVDEYNNPQPTETTYTAACELQQFANEERTVDADLQRGDWNLFVAPTCTSSDGVTVDTDGVLTGSDTVTIDDVPYEVDGPPWPARNPRTQTVTHLQAKLRRTA